MKIYLLNPPYFPHFGREMRWQDTGRGGTLYYPIWLSYATGLLEKEGHTARLVDAPAWNWNVDDVLADLKQFEPALIVISMSFTSLNNDLNIAEKIKEVCPSPIVAVGPPTSQFAEQMLLNVDIVARYEYDFTLAELANKFERKETIQNVLGISFRECDKCVHNSDRPWSTSEQLTAMPFVSNVYKRHLNIKDYFLNYSLYPLVQIFAGRGCPFNCTFCSWPQSFTGKRYRVHSVESILDELSWIERELPEVKEVFFEDDTFTIIKKRVIDFCNGYINRGLKVSWSCNARVDTLDLDTMKLMRKANCRFLIVGFESADDKILQNIKKGFTVKQSHEFAANVKKSGLMLHADFVIGLPGETYETIQKTRDFINNIRPDQLQISVSSPFPGTEFYDWCCQNGYVLTNDPNEYLDDLGHQKAIISYPDLTNTEMVQEVDSILKDYYLSLCYIPVAARQVFRKGGFREFLRLFYSVKMFAGYLRSR